IADGRGMLLHQGCRSFELWTGQPAPIAAMREALDQALRQRN
ncbi:MAG: shikimate dehydrogenase, partial [Lentisphaerae bacterium]|nr:shikimate dehydrogenase [Lentisphaerota bacterium]